MALPRRIHITGASGSGTTTLGKALAERVDSKFFDADDYYWHPSNPPFRSKRSNEERLRLILDDLSPCEQFVLSGSVATWGKPLEATFELVVFLYLPPELRMARILCRETERFGTPNPDFIKWAASYDTGGLHIRSRALHEAWLSTITCPVLRLEGDMTTEQRIEIILKSDV